MKQSYLIGLAVMLLILAQSAYGYNLRSLKYSPVSYFNEQDWDMAKEAARKALNESKTGDTVSWSNPDSGNSGELKVIDVSEQKGQSCKTLQIINRARNLEGKGAYLFCRQPEGTWQLSRPNSK